jgi:hypothetical protein
VGRVMSAVVGWWTYFGKFLKEQGVVQDFPDKPHVGFFLKHAGLAVDFWKDGLHNEVNPVANPGLKPYLVE